VDEFGEIVIFTQPNTQPDENDEEQAEAALMRRRSPASLAIDVDPIFARKSANKQVELLLGSLRREKAKVNEFNIKFEIIMKDYKAKVQLN
jgi:hypothetical protein